MILVKWCGDTLDFPCVHDFVQEWITDDIVENLISNEFDEIDIPLGIGKVSMGKIIRNTANVFQWETIYCDYIEYLTEQIEDDLDRNYGTTEFEGFLIEEVE